MSYLNVSKVYVTARLWKVRTDVKISAECSGTPADGYQVESVTTTPNVISVSGSDEAYMLLLSRITQYGFQQRLLIYPAGIRTVKKK